MQHLIHGKLLTSFYYFEYFKYLMLCYWQFKIQDGTLILILHFLAMQPGLCYVMLYPNAVKTKYMLLSCRQGAGQNHDIR
jgi:hypothetical protein